jgi:hypothetical protein
VTWSERHTTACAGCPALAAVYEAPDGRLALLLRHTIVPLPEEREAWLEATGRAADDVAAVLRKAGLTRRYVVAQWQPFEEVAAIFDSWRCRYLGDPERCRQLAAVVERFVVDYEAVPAQPTGPISAWYDDMAACWLAADPPLRRSLILRAHRFIAERVLLPLSRGVAVEPEDLEPDGPLARLLLRAVPAGDVARWRPWIDLVLTDMRRALAWPPSRRDQSWARWLFLIPYSIPAPRGLVRETA